MSTRTEEPRAAKMHLEQQFTHVERPTVKGLQRWPGGHEPRETVMALTVVGGAGRALAAGAVRQGQVRPAPLRGAGVRAGSGPHRAGLRVPAPAAAARAG